MRAHDTRAGRQSDRAIDSRNSVEASELFDLRIEWYKPFHQHLGFAKSSNMTTGVRYPIQLASVSEDHAALYEESLKNPEQFWGDLARRRLRWVKDFDQVMDCDMHTGRFKWFIGGVLNVSGECATGKAP